MNLALEADMLRNKKTVGKIVGMGLTIIFEAVQVESKLLSENNAESRAGDNHVNFSRKASAVLTETE